MTEEDTFNRLRRVPITEILREYSDLSQSELDELWDIHSDWFEDEDLSFSEKFYNDHGWTYQEFVASMRTSG